MQDLIRLGKWTINAGAALGSLSAYSESASREIRGISISRYFPSAGVVLHFSYDRVFQTPSFENILLSSSPRSNRSIREFSAPARRAFRRELLRSRRDQGFLRKAQAGRKLFPAVTSTITPTTIRSTTRPSASQSRFVNPMIYGAEAKLDLLTWHGFSGFLSYSYIVGNVWFPVTGGLFLGDDATAAETQLTGHFPDSQDQRNTVRGRVRYQVAPRFWIAGGIQYDYWSPIRIRRRSIHRPRGIWSASSQSHQFRARPNLSLISSERIAGRRRLQIRTSEYAISSGRIEPDKCSGSNRFRRTLLRQRDRTIAQLCAPSHQQLLRGTLSAPHRPLKLTTCFTAKWSK